MRSTQSSLFGTCVSFTPCICKYPSRVIVRVVIAKYFCEVFFVRVHPTFKVFDQVHLEVLRPWVTKKVTQYIGLEDDIIINMVMAELEKVTMIAFQFVSLQIKLV